MSRTDVHRPWWVQVADPSNRHRLHFYAKFEGEWLVMALYGTCGCRLCTEQHLRRLQIKQQRVNWRRVRSDLLKTIDADREDMDVAPWIGSSV